MAKLKNHNLTNSDYSEIKKRDMDKPVRREELAISPRLAKILINLSGVKQGELLLDPFCGIGGILIEALIKKINVYGVDKDKQVVADAKKNFQWLSNNFRISSRYTIINDDSRNVQDLKFDAVATETPLGKLLRKKPSDKEAIEIIRDFEKIIIPVLSHVKNIKKSQAKIAITFPVVKHFHVDVKKIIQRTGLVLILNPVLETRSDQLISRDILVLS